MFSFVIRAARWLMLMLLWQPLRSKGFTVTIDRRDIPYGEEWQKELTDFIRAADTVIWLASPASVISQWCK